MVHQAQELKPICSNGKMLQLGCNKFLNRESVKIPTEDLCPSDQSPSRPQVDTGVMLSLL